MADVSRSLERTNQIFWSSLTDIIKEETIAPVESILDIGCDQGGLLLRLAGLLHPTRLIGIEPAASARERARFRLSTIAPAVTLISPNRWSEISSGSVDLITCHEVLHRVEDISSIFYHISRTLRVNGTAYIVAGCHTENPLWPRWAAQLRDAGQATYDRSPFDILRTGINAGLSGAIKPLRRDGWIIYDPDHAVFTYTSVGELLDHQYRYKLLFRFVKEQ